MRGPWPRLLRRLIMTLSPYLQEVAKRRTFAIISHPDAAQPFNA
ncbi:TPA: peptide chain release factor 3 [Klebsiella pneumoniae]|nr:peptide chain release factor 3 [Klebsiella pneumoniae]HBZ3646160.1 peptide chain release factor 3 [Klebsiella pneumoniae]